MTNNTINFLIFLGVCDRFRQNGSTSEFLLPKYDVLGLGDHALFPIFPFSLQSITLCFASRVRQNATLNLVVRDSSGEAVCTSVAKVSVNAINTETGSIASEADLSSYFPNYIMCPIHPSADTWATKPDIYNIFQIDDDQSEHKIGMFVLGEIDIPPLTPDRISAIRSNPHATKGIEMGLKCKKCDSEIRAYASLDRDDSKHIGMVWHEDLPDVFSCRCSSVHLSLQSVRRKLRSLLGFATPIQSENISFAPLYEENAIGETYHAFVRLIGQETDEETIQVFIQKNLLVLNEFSAQKILFKPPILNKFRADFAIINSRNELILIEIERANLPLLKKDGGTSSSLTHAFDQVHDWLHEIEQHRLAALYQMGLKNEHITRIKGIVIAGRDTPYKQDHLRKLKSVSRSNVEFMTYDDLALSLAVLSRNIRKL